MTNRSNRIAKRWFLLVGLAVAAFVVAMVATLLWPPSGPIAALDDVEHETVAEAEVHEDGWYTAAQALVGDDTYAESCAQCHGEDLEGGVGPALAGEPFWDRWGGESVHAFFEITRQTMPQGNPGSLSDQRYADLTAYVLQVNGFPPGESELPTDAETLQALTIARAATTEPEAEAPEAEEPEPEPEPEPEEPEPEAEPDAGWFTSAQAERGLEAYAQHCAECHGGDLDGSPPLMGEAFLDGYDSVGALFDYVVASMPLADPGSLEEATYADIVAYILDRNAFPEGEDELDPDQRDAMDDMPLGPDAASGSANGG